MKKYLLKLLKNSQGLALVTTIMMMMIMLSMTAASLFFSQLDLKASSNLKSGSGAIHAADAGIEHGIVLIPKGTEFDSLLQGSVSGFPLVSGVPTLTGTLSGYTYTVVAGNDVTVPGETATDDANQIVLLTATGSGSDGSTRKIKAYLGRSSTSWTPPGTIFIPGAAPDMEFDIESGSIISGNDTNIDDTAGPQAAVPGIATTDSDATTEAISSIEPGASVTGAGGTPSVATTSSTLSITDLVNGFLANPNTELSGTVEDTVLGTWDAPQITHFIGGGEARIRGSSSGAGVIIADGSLRIEDNFDFKGLIILRNGGELRLEIGGASPIYGAVLLAPGSADGNPELDWRGTGIKYSSQALDKVNSTWPGVLPQEAKLIAWHEVM